MPRGVELSHSLIAHRILYVHIGKYLEWEFIYKGTLNVQSTLGWWFCGLVWKGKFLLSILMASVMCSHFSMLKDNVLEHTATISRLVKLWSTCRHTTMQHKHVPHNTIEQTHAKILVSALKCQVS